MTVLGLHPNTTDQAVIRYLEAHGKVNRSDKVIHHVFPGTPGSTLCAGKLNGNRSYVMDIKTPMGSFHIIDGEKVTIRYNGQEWTCARCHQLKRLCPGRAIARDCTAERVLLSSHMEAHWQKLGFKPETEANSEVDILQEVDIQVGHTRKEKPVLQENKFQNRYKSVNRIVIPSEFAISYTTIVHRRYNHPSKAKMLKMFNRRFYMLDAEKEISHVNESCELCRATRQIPKDV